MAPFTLLIKPSGSDCNLDCKYCFYKNRPAGIGQGRQRMTDETLEKLTKDYLGLDNAAPAFAWQGGEPTLMGLDFYKKAVELQKKYQTPNQKIINTIQTNAILLDENWCKFLHDNNFLLGVSIDGPKELHDFYRLDHAGSGTFDKVTNTINLCKEYKVEFNALVLLNDKNVEHPDELFDFFTAQQIWYLQFIPCVETDPSTCRILDFSITPKQYGSFLCRLFDRWRARNPIDVSIRDFDSILQYCLNGLHTVCTFARHCGDYIVIEHNGDVFCCDFFVDPKWRIGNIFETPIENLAAGEKKRNFARTKENLCNKCFVCRHLNICRTGCLKHKFDFDGNKNSESYFCESYKRFFDHSIPLFMQLAATISSARKP